MTMSRAFLCLIVAVLFTDYCFTATLPRNFDPRLTDEMVLTPKKRPFCNAFTGCGRKRSQASPGMPPQEVLRPKQYMNEESIGILLDFLNALGDLFRQAEMQSKHWEAFQDDLSRQKQDDMLYNNQ